MEIEDRIILIIAKKVTGEITNEELSQLQLWLNADLGNQAEYERLVKIWNNTGNLFSKQDFNTNIAWSKVDATINNRLKDKTNSKKALVINGFFYKRLAVAAVAILVLGTVFYILNINKSQQLLFARNSNELITMPDSSVVLLRKGSTIKYPVVFDKSERRVELEGEAFFKVYRDEKVPFLITTANSTVKVLGTSFLVRSNNSMDEIVVLTGKVIVTDKRKKLTQVMLIAGQQAILKDDRFQQSQVKDSNYIAWNNGILEFKDAPITKVLEDISHYYEIAIGVSGEHNAAIENIRINVRFEKQSLEQVLEEIRLITGLEMKKENNKTIFYQK